ncbi:putative ras GTPase-activating protein 3-like isoform X1 [Sesbania bispinosa]|nr:putative ras GTPase-activating protein 3-like isoform X1 [Sesbania bispinosa]
MGTPTFSSRSLQKHGNMQSSAVNLNRRSNKSIGAARDRDLTRDGGYGGGEWCVVEGVRTLTEVVLCGICDEEDADGVGAVSMDGSGENAMVAASIREG